MGAAQSSSSDPAQLDGAPSSAPPRLPPPPPGVAASRYWSVALPGSAKVHVLGVYPCSTRSAEESYALVKATDPSALYIDLPREVLIELRRDVDAGRVVSKGWRPPAEPPSFLDYVGRSTEALDADTASPVASSSSRPDVAPPLFSLPTGRTSFWTAVDVASYRADNEMFGLVGAEADAAYKAALLARKELSEPMNSNSGSGRAGCRLLPYPFPLDYSAEPASVRPAHVRAALVGNASWNSTALAVQVGNPYNPTAAKPEVELVVDTAGHHTTATAGPDAASRLNPPPVGTGSRLSVTSTTRVRADFAAEVEAALATTGSAEALDLEAMLLGGRDACTAAGDAVGAMQHEALAEQARAQSRAIAYQLQTAAAEAGEGASIVALVNLGQLGSLQRGWYEATEPMACFLPRPGPMRTVNHFGGVIGIGITAGFGYAAWRGWRWAGKRGKIVMAATLGPFSAFYMYAMTHRPWMGYGSAVRTQLATPSVVPPAADVTKTY